MIVEATKRCSPKSGCGQVLPVSEFYIRKSGKLTHVCRRCSRRAANRWKAENPERHSANIRKWRRNNPIANKAHNLVNYARQNGPSDIDADWVMERLERGVCEFSGVPFVYETGHPHMPSIDRIKVTQPGHMKDNCRVILWGLNGYKGVASEEVFRECIRTLCAAFNQS
jgi:hypothetical protein